MYSNLFEAMRNYKINGFYNYNKSVIEHYFRNKKGVGICSIGRKENLYAKEFVEYYLKLGIKKIIIYDNNDIDGEKFEDVLEQYIKNKYVEIIDVRGFQSIKDNLNINDYIVLLKNMWKKSEVNLQTPKS